VTTLLLLYRGPATTADASHAGWPEWFKGLGDKLVDRGSPMTNGFVVNSDGSTSETAANFNGYSIIRADDREQALELLRDHPFLSHGREYTIEVFEVPSK
jgi:YCII-related domain